MGFILALPTEANPFYAEVRRESYHIGTDYGTGVIEARRDREDREDRGAFAVPTARVPALLVALDEVTVSRRYRDWRTGAALKAGDVGPESPAVRWTITGQDQRLIVTGRVTVFGSDGGWAPVQSVELCYRDLADLTVQLHRSVRAMA